MTTATEERVIARYEPRGGIRELFGARDPEILVEGPANTGKTYGICWLLHLLALQYPGLRVLICRKTLVSLTSTALRTFAEKVLQPGEPVRFFGGSKSEAASFKYSNGSRIVVGGLDNPDKIMSSEYDLVYVNEATDLNLEDWETLTTRLGRDGVLKAARIIGDCNPRTDKHWLNQRCNAGLTRRIHSSHEDNPTVTQEYMDTLDRLTGSRKARLRYGEWVGVENAIYPQFDRDTHVVDLPAEVRFVDGAFGADYGRVHKSAAVAISVDQYGRRWVREAWTEADAENGGATALNVGRLRDRYKLRRGRVDPNQDALIGLLKAKGVTTASLAERSRKARIDITAHALSIFPAGRYVPFRQELRAEPPRSVYVDADTPGLLFVKGAPGIDELCDQMEAYHYVHRSSDVKDEDIVARIDEDMVAAMEYGLEELESALPSLPTRARMLMPTRGPERQGAWHGV